MTIFIDSAAYRAISSKFDDKHDLAKKKFLELAERRNRILTTDYVIDETYTGLLIRPGFWAAKEFDKSLTESGIKIEFVGADRFKKAQEVFRRFNKDKKWSFTDCTSYVVMKELRLKKVFTFDENFEEMGFELF